MAPDVVTKTTKQSWFQRTGNAFQNMVIGILLFIAAFPLLFWNEGRAVRRAKSLDEGAKNVVSVVADTVEVGNEGVLVHFTGEATTTDILTDSDFSLSVNAIKLSRNVEMYQWTEDSESETKEKLGGGTETTTTYTYKKDWADSLVDSSDFEEPIGHENPANMAYDDKTFEASTVTVGAYKLSETLISRMNYYEDHQPDDGNLSSILTSSLLTNAEISGKYIYIGNNPNAPEVGDLRISFAVVNPTNVSIIGQQMGETVTAYKAKAGSDILLLQRGTVDAESMFETAQQQNTLILWVLRIVGLVMMYAGLMTILKPLAVTGSVIPLLGNIVEGLLGVVAGLIALALTLVTVSIAWLFYRPLLGGALLIAGIALIAGAKFMAGKKKA